MKNKINPHRKENQCSEHIIKFDSCEERKNVNLDVNMCCYLPKSNEYVVSFSSCELDKVISVNAEINPSIPNCSDLDSLLKSPIYCVYDENFYDCECNCNLPITSPKPEPKPKSELKPKPKPRSEHIPPHTSTSTSNCTDNRISHQNDNINSATIITPNDYIYEIVLDPSDIITDDSFDTSQITTNSELDKNTANNNSKHTIERYNTISKDKYSKMDKVMPSSNSLDNLGTTTLTQPQNLLNNTSKSKEDNSSIDTTLILPLLSTLIDYFLKYYDCNNSTQDNKDRFDKRDKHHKHSKHHKSDKHNRHNNHSKNTETSNILVALIDAILKKLK